MSTEPDLRDEILWAATSFRVDAVTAEVTRALAAESIPSILVKGPAIATWLYAGEAPRLYGDTDLLVRREDWDRVMEIVQALGFEDELGPMAHPRMESGAGYPWGRSSDDAHLDLHYTLFGIGVEPEALWDAFAEEAVEESVGGTKVRMPSHPARLLHIVLHAVQHGGDFHAGEDEVEFKPMQDLALALAKAPRESWTEAHALAERLEAGAVFASGLDLLPEGRELAAAIGIDGERSADAALRLEWVPLAEGFRELSEASGCGEAGHRPPRGLSHAGVHALVEPPGQESRNARPDPRLPMATDLAHVARDPGLPRLAPHPSLRFAAHPRTCGDGKLTTQC